MHRIQIFNEAHASFYVLFLQVSECLLQFVARH